MPVSEYPEVRACVRVRSEIHAAMCVAACRARIPGIMMRPVEIERGFQLAGQAVTDGSKYAMVPNGTASEVV